MEHSATPEDEQPDLTTYGRVGFCLLYGLLFSIAVMLAGLLYGALQGRSASSHVLPLDKIPARLGSLDPSALLDLGILLLFATPLAGVVVAFEEFLRLRDLAFALITLVLLILLLAGFIVAFH